MEGEIVMFKKRNKSTIDNANTYSASSNNATNNEKEHGESEKKKKTHYYTWT